MIEEQFTYCLRSVKRLFELVLISAVLYEVMKELMSKFLIHSTFKQELKLNI